MVFDLNLELTLVGLLFSVLAFGLTLYGIRQANIGIRQSDKGFELATQHAKRMAEQVDKMEKLAHSVPTRALASRAEHLRFIGAIIEKAERGELKILTDTADYGSFFDSTNHRRVFEAIVGAKRRGVEVRVRVGGPLRHITTASEFADKNYTRMRTGDRRFKLRLRTYLEYLRAESDTDDTFKRWLSDRAEDDAKRDAFRGWLRENEAEGPGADGLEAGDAALKHNLAHCLSVYAHKHATLTEDEAAAFQTLLWAREKYFEELLLLRADVRVERIVSLRPAIFFWLRDDPDEPVAAFIFAQSDSDAPGSAMTTVDPNFLGFFRATFEQAIRR